MCGKDIRGKRAWPLSQRDGVLVTLGSTGIVLKTGNVLCVLGAVLESWPDCQIKINGLEAEVERICDASSPFLDDIKFAILRPKEPLPLDDCNLKHQAGVCQQYAMHLTHPAWGLLTQPCHIVSRPSSEIALIDVSCYAGGEGGLVVSANEKAMILVSGFAAEGAPTGLSVCADIAWIFGDYSSVEKLISEPKDPRVLTVVGAQGQWGTGFRLKDGRVVTAGHVVSGRHDSRPSSVQVQSSGDASWIRAKVELLWPGDWLDLCFLRLEEEEEEEPNETVGFQLSDNEAKHDDGEKNVTLLSATQWGDQMRTTGCIMNHGAVQFVSNLVSWGGCSGAPVVAENTDKVVGILLSTASQGRMRIPRLSLILPTNVWAPLLKDASALPDRLSIENIWTGLSHKAPLPKDFAKVLAKL